MTSITLGNAVSIISNSKYPVAVNMPDTVYVKIFVIDLISLFSWLASMHENFSLSEVSQTKIFPTNFCLDSELVTKLTVRYQTCIPTYLPAYCDDNNDQIATS